MSPERSKPPELTAEQQEAGAFLIEACGLEELADQPVEMMGQTGTVRFGLARCSEHLLEMTPAEIADMVTAKIRQQQSGQSHGGGQ